MLKFGSKQPEQNIQIVQDPGKETSSEEIFRETSIWEEGEILIQAKKSVPKPASGKAKFTFSRGNLHRNKHPGRRNSVGQNHLVPEFNQNQPAENNMSHNSRPRTHTREFKRGRSTRCCKNELVLSEFPEIPPELAPGDPHGAEIQSRNT